MIIKRVSVCPKCNSTNLAYTGSGVYVLFCRDCGHIITEERPRYAGGQ